MSMEPPSLLLHGFDTLQCAYYLLVTGNSGFDFRELAVKKESLQHRKSKDPEMIEIGEERELGSELEKNRQAIERLYEAVEAGLLPHDATLTERAHKLQTRQEILTEMAGIKREAGMPNELLSEKNVRAFCNALRKRLHDPGSSFGKQYLRLLVKDVRITGKEIRMRGSYEGLAQTVAFKKLGTPEGVPSFIPVWRAIPDETGHCWEETIAVP